MAIIQPVRGVAPQIDETCFLAENAVVVGDVTLGPRCTVWFGAVIRGDVNMVRIGSETNIQDGAIVHCTYQKTSVTIGNRVSVGHAAIIHGCTIEDEVLIGMGAIVMDRARVRTGAVVAAGAVVTEGMELEAGWVYVGAPARKVKVVDDRLLEMVCGTARRYPMYAEWFGPQGGK